MPTTFCLLLSSKSKSYMLADSIQKFLFLLVWIMSKIMYENLFNIRNKRASPPEGVTIASNTYYSTIIVVDCRKLNQVHYRLLIWSICFEGNPAEKSKISCRIRLRLARTMWWQNSTISYWQTANWKCMKYSASWV